MLAATEVHLGLMNYFCLDVILPYGTLASMQFDSVTEFSSSLDYVGVSCRLAGLLSS